jgi:hypothetical protein
MLTSHELLGFMSPNLALEIINFAYDTDKALYRATLAGVAEARKVRPIFLERQPRAQRHATMTAALSKPSLELVTGNLIRGWLLKKYKNMLVDFLDALGISHQEGVVEDLPVAMEDEKLKAAVNVLISKYPPEVVAVYLNAFNEMNEVEWTNLKSMLEQDDRLQLGTSA